MNISLRIVSLVVVSFAAASAFSTDAPSVMHRSMQNHSATAQAARPSDGALQMVAVKCTNPRECSVGGA
ncbi:hypothetical protein BJI69_00930 [Luteibacter rhizovicinus DSM 16549]|uniref:Secreted protein n=1 Tax=Luteibacter rhizovicinus DSM 16549 TaxID=1440763 RepID=A0A1L3ENG5_9GAMM|nr:hypothetical protein [Luteibacter rhizovicinus]APG02608.1 hypothetical protein BJI69_00930 [Luteibacter rhizovicinus DSM 16549]KLD78271.1 hypothetical protein Y886_11150 [Xanthomonas hyacinthi DSM 19077]